MKFLFVLLFAIWSLPSLAIAGSGRPDHAQFKAVTDAIFNQHKIRQDETLLSITLAGRLVTVQNIFVARQYLIQYADPKGQCTQETVEATTYLATHQTQVIFLPTPRRPCR